LKYGFDILQEMGLKSNVIRAGQANMFLSPVFREAFVNTMNTRLELYKTDGATGAALGSGLGIGIYKSFNEAFIGLELMDFEIPNREKTEQYAMAYSHWKNKLNSQI
jgi:xylulokinase